MNPIGPDLRAGPLGPACTSPVGWLYSRSRARWASCFLVSEWWIASAAHALAEKDVAEAYIAIFNFVADVDPDDRDAYAIAPETGYLNLGMLDVVFVRLQERVGQMPPGERWGRIGLAAARTPAVGEEVISVQYPDVSATAPVKSFSRGAVRAVEDYAIVHDAEEAEGSSGAPLLDPSGAWLGVHTKVRGDNWGAAPASRVIATLAAMDLSADLRGALQP